MPAAASAMSGADTTTLTAITPRVTRVCGKARRASLIASRPFTASPSAANASAGTTNPRAASPSAAAACTRNGVTASSIGLSSRRRPPQILPPYRYHFVSPRAATPIATAAPSR